MNKYSATVFLLFLQMVVQAADLPEKDSLLSYSTYTRINSDYRRASVLMPDGKTLRKICRPICKETEGGIIGQSQLLKVEALIHRAKSEPISHLPKALCSGMAPVDPYFIFADHKTVLLTEGSYCYSTGQTWREGPASSALRRIGVEIIEHPDTIAEFIDKLPVQEFF